MFHNSDGTLSLTPMYDVVASAYYEQFKEMALQFNGKKAELSKLKPKDIVDFAFNKKGFIFSQEHLLAAVKQLEANKAVAVHAINNGVSEHNKVKERLISMIEKRWNGTFNGIESYLKKMKR